MGDGVEGGEGGCRSGCSDSGEEAVRGKDVTHGRNR